MVNSRLTPSFNNAQRIRYGFAQRLLLASSGWEYASLGVFTRVAPDAVSEPMIAPISETLLAVKLRLRLTR